MVTLTALGLLLGRVVWAPEAVRPSAKVMLVVLPFENLGAAEDEYFADGITEEITSRLASIHALGVIARTSAMQYKRTTKNIQQIGSELGVGYVLEGSVRWAKSRNGQSIVRVTPQLIGVSDATHIWSEVYEADIAEVFKVQADIATRVAGALKVSLLEPEQRAVELAPTANTEAYDLLLRARPMFGGGYAREKYEESIRYLRQAVTLDPSFAQAYAWLSIAHSAMYWFHWDRTEARLAEGREAAERALALQPALGGIQQDRVLSDDRAVVVDARDHLHPRRVEPDPPVQGLLVEPDREQLASDRGQIDLLGRGVRIVRGKEQVGQVHRQAVARRDPEDKGPGTTVRSELEDVFPRWYGSPSRRLYGWPARDGKALKARSSRTGSAARPG